MGLTRELLNVFNALQDTFVPSEVQPSFRIYVQKATIVPEELNMLTNFLVLQEHTEIPRGYRTYRSVSVHLVACMLRFMELQSQAASVLADFFVKAVRCPEHQKLDQLEGHVHLELIVQKVQPTL
jgi:hypothetical protein